MVHGDCKAVLCQPSCRGAAESAGRSCDDCSLSHDALLFRNNCPYKQRDSEANLPAAGRLAATKAKELGNLGRRKELRYMGAWGRGGQFLSDPALCFTYTAKTQQTGLCPTHFSPHDFH